jgi:hypothetical protein
MPGRTTPSVPTVSSLRQQQRRLDRQRAGAARALAVMRRGEALQKHFTRQGPVYTLTNGLHVAPDAAELVIADVRVVPVNDGLFLGTPQTWRLIES